VVADDQAAVRDGLATLLGLMAGVDVVGVAGDGAEAVTLVGAHAPEVVLMDLRMPRMDGVEATRAIRRDHPATQVVVLTTYADDESILAALDAGALGYLTKDAGRDDIRRALEAAAAGQAVLDPTVQARLLHAARSPAPAPSGPPPDGLTQREVEVLALMTQGLSNAAIAAALYVSEPTVKTHINHIFSKTHCTSRAEAIAYAHRHGLAATTR
jgi:DNA-binding NarL/FixJ family response regulator